ncbi:hypothetical protein AB0A69_29095 [Streptomyces sp. NPDC045431]|uniref:hypothetical protein n=1 Tax=Streptomyces sp. NPDC045431 TaxID=3155613 RepID=UPI0033DC396D
MVARGKAGLVVSVVTVLAAVAASDAGAGAAAGAPAAGATGAIAPEADVAHHGHVSLDGDRLEVLMASQNHGPSGVPTTTVRLAFSVPLAGGPPLPPNCLWGGDREVLCSTGPLRADGPARDTVLDLRTAGAPHEVTVRVATEWNGGATDRNPGNNDHQVLVPATGDWYVF